MVSPAPFFTMATIQILIKRFEGLQGKEIQLAREALQESSTLAMDLVAGQLAKGILSDGSRSDFTYSPHTVAQKKQRTGLSGITAYLTNYDTGESYEKLFMEVNGNKVIFGTKTEKEDAISDRMDGKAFIPTDDSRKIFITEKAYPAFIEKIRGFVKL